MSDNSSSTGQKHPYHLVDPSPLPFLSSIAASAITSGPIPSPGKSKIFLVLDII